MVFKNGGTLSKYEKWFYHGEMLEVVNEFVTYVGVLITRQMSLNKMAHEQSLKSKRVLMFLLSKLPQYGQMSRRTFFKLFDTKVPCIIIWSRDMGL